MSSASFHSHPRLYTQRDRRPLIDQVAADWGNVLWLVGRILIGGVFVQSGFAKLLGVGAFANSLTGNGVPAAEVLAPLGACVEFFGGLAIVLGIGTRCAAILMMAFVVTATLISHRFWSAVPAQEHAQAIQFAKNVVIFGGFLFVFVTGGGRFSLDRWWHPQKINVAS